MTTPSPERPSLREAARALLAVFERCGPSKPVSALRDDFGALTVALSEEASLPSREGWIDALERAAWDWAVADLATDPDKHDRGSLRRRLATALEALLPAQGEAWRPIEATPALVSYVARYGGMCRDCADEDGICPRSGMPCELADETKAIHHVIEALNYGFAHGYLPPPNPEVAG